MVKNNLGMVMIYMNNEQGKSTSLGISKLGNSLSSHSYRSEAAVWSRGWFVKMFPDAIDIEPV